MGKIAVESCTRHWFKGIKTDLENLIKKSINEMSWNFLN